MYKKIATSQSLHGSYLPFKGSPLLSICALLLNLPFVNSENSTNQISINQNSTALSDFSKVPALTNKSLPLSQEESNLYLIIILSSTLGSLFLVTLAYQMLKCYLSSSKVNNAYIDRHQNLEEKLPEFFKSVISLLSNHRMPTVGSMLQFDDQFDQKFQPHLKPLIADIQELFCDSYEKTERYWEKAFSHAKTLHGFVVAPPVADPINLESTPCTSEDFFKTFLKETAEYPEAIKLITPTCLFSDRQSELTDISKRKNEFVKSFLRDISLLLHFLINKETLLSQPDTRSYLNECMESIQSSSHSEQINNIFIDPVRPSFFKELRLLRSVIIDEQSEQTDGTQSILELINVICDVLSNHDFSKDVKNYIKYVFQQEMNEGLAPVVLRLESLVRPANLYD